MSKLLEISGRFETYERIRDRMLDGVSDSVKKDETSLMYNAICPIAWELYRLSTSLQISVASSYVDTAVGARLDAICRQMGITRLGATNMKLLVDVYSAPGEVDLSVAVGTVFCNLDKTFRVVSSSPTILQCTSSGRVSLVDDWRASSFYNLHEIKVKEILEYGSDLENDDELRERAVSICNYYPFSGNVNSWRLEVKKRLPQLSHVRVVTRKEDMLGHNLELYILEDNKVIASDSLLAEYKKVIGDIAPVGQYPLVLTPTSICSIVPKIYVTIKAGVNRENITMQIQSQVDSYCESLLDKWEDTEELVVYSGQLQAHLMATIPDLLNVENILFGDMTKVTFTRAMLPKLKSPEIAFEEVV